MYFKLSLRLDWREASKCAEFLAQNCAWSRASNMHQLACFQYMIMEEEGNRDMRDHVRDCYARVGQLRIRWAGKTVPLEKFAVSKADRFIKSRPLSISTTT